MRFSSVSLVVIMASGTFSLEANAGIQLWPLFSSKAETTVEQKEKDASVYSRVRQAKQSTSFGQKFRRLSLRWASLGASSKSAENNSNASTRSVRRSSSTRGWRISRNNRVTPATPPVAPAQPAPAPTPKPVPSPAPAPLPVPVPVPVPEPVKLGKATLSWQTPTERVNGTALSTAEIGSYEIYYTSETAGASQTIVVSSATQKTYTVNGLKPDSYHFSMVTVDSNGIYSELSKVVSKTIN